MKSPKLWILVIAIVLAVGSLAYAAGKGNLRLSWDAVAPTHDPSVTPNPTTSPVTASAKPGSLSSPAAPAQSMGTITGALSFPSEGLPKDMKVCAENQATKTETCTTEKMVVNTPQPHTAYSLSVPTGKYLVYAIVPSFNLKYRAYYSAFVTCGLKYECKDHAPLVVDVKAGQTVSGVDPQDWYNTTP
jgi:hypothetical protein